MALVLLTKDTVLADYLTSDCPRISLVLPSLKGASSEDAFIVDADSCPPPFPPRTLLVIMRAPLGSEEIEDVPVLLRPLAPKAIDRILDGEDESNIRKHASTAVLTKKAACVLPKAEYLLFSALMAANGAILSRKELCACLEESEGDAEGLLTVYIYRLRKHLAPLGLTLRTHHKKGYSLERTGEASC